MRMTQEDLQAMFAELVKLQAAFPGLAGPSWIRKAAMIIWQICEAGPADFGGPDVLAWWLVQRCKPRKPLTKAKVKQLIRLSGGSQKTLDLLVAMTEERSKPNRLATGWSFMQVNSYLTMLRAERAR